MKHQTDLDDWIEFNRAWLDEQQSKQDALDAAAWLRFREMVLKLFDA